MQGVANDLVIQIEASRSLYISVTWPSSMKNVERLMGIRHEGRGGKTYLNHWCAMIQRFANYTGSTKNI